MGRAPEELGAGRGSRLHSPQFLLRRGGVQRVLQLCFQCLQLLAQVPLLLLRLVPRRLFGLQVFLQLGDLRLQLPHHLECVVLVQRLVIASVETSALRQCPGHGTPATPPLPQAELLGREEGLRPQSWQWLQLS